MSNTNTTHTLSRATLWKLIKDIKFGMFGTYHTDGHFHARPMTTQSHLIDEHDVLWFFMSRKGDTVTDVMANPQVNVTYADPGKDTYVSVSGNATVVEDMAKKNELWNVFAKAWFPGGAKDEDLALVQVKIMHCQYWDVHESKLVQLYQIAKAAITGEPPSKMGETGEIQTYNN